VLVSVAIAPRAATSSEEAVAESSGPMLARISGLYENEWNRSGLGMTIEC